MKMRFAPSRTNCHSPDVTSGESDDTNIMYHRFTDYLRAHFSLFLSFVRQKKEDIILYCKIKFSIIIS